MDFLAERFLILFLQLLNELYEQPSDKSFGLKCECIEDWK